MTPSDYEELKKLDEAYRRLFPDAEVFDYENSNLSYEPSHYLAALREANGREIVFTTPEGQCDGGNFSFIEVADSKRFNPITLQELLYSRGLTREPRRVKLIRHLDTGNAPDLIGLYGEDLIPEQAKVQNLHALYRNDLARFFDYQRQQGRNKHGGAVFDKCDYIVSFLGEEGAVLDSLGYLRWRAKTRHEKRQNTFITI